MFLVIVGRLSVLKYIINLYIIKETTDCFDVIKLQSKEEIMIIERGQIKKLN